MKKIITITGVLSLLILLINNFAFAGWNPKTDAEMSDEINATIQKFKTSDPAMKGFFDKAYGYAVFPTVGKGGIGIGAAYGEGKVFEQNIIVGSTTLKQISIGFQLGGQAYSEIIFFKEKKDLDNFTSGNFELGAAASAVAVTKGASADADYSDGVAIFTLPKGGLMYEATVAGQKFTFRAE